MQPRRELSDGEIGSGSVSSVMRSGLTIRRPCGPWTPAVHALLRHLEGKNYRYSPRVVRLEAECEVLEYIEGEVAMRPWPSCLLEDSGMAAIAKAICDYHQVVADFVPPVSAMWRDPELQWQPGMIVRHGDLGPWNMVWREGKLVGIIDWDMAEPGYLIEDIAQVAWQAVPLRPPAACREAGIDTGAVQMRRLAILCEICEVSQSSVIDTLKGMQKAEMVRTESRGSKDIEPWVSFRARGDVAILEREGAWLQSQPL